MQRCRVVSQLSVSKSNLIRFPLFFVFPVMDIHSVWIMATYKWLLIVYYLLLRVLCEANNEENWSEMVSMIRNKELCWSSCQNHELTFTKSNQTESNGTVSNYRSVHLTIMLWSFGKLNEWIDKYRMLFDNVTRNCQCDEECEDYGDCCYDAASVSKDRTVKKNNKDGSWACLPLRFKDNNYKLDEEVTHTLTRILHWTESADARHKVSQLHSDVHKVLPVK